MPTHDCAAAGLAAVNAMRAASGDQPITADQVTEETLADTIADVLHLAARLHTAGQIGEDPAEVLDHGRTYFEGDLEEPWTTPAALEPAP